MAKKRHISDPHYHLWKPSTHSWLKDKEALANHPAGDINSVGRDYNITEFIHESDKYILDKSVHIQCYADDPLQETAALQEIADNAPLSNGHPHGIIAYADLESKDIQQTLLKHMQSRNFRGIRQCLDYHPKHENRRLCPRDNLMMDPLFHRGLRVMTQYNLIFDMQLYPMQLRSASVLAAAHPKLRIVVNHCAFPLFEKDGDIREWINGLRLIAQNENVFMKLSGWCIFDQKFDKQSMKFIVKMIVNIFGVNRCMFASDFPVEKPHAHYDLYWDLYIEILCELSYNERDIDKMIHLNANRIYKLNGAASKCIAKL